MFNQYLLVVWLFSPLFGLFDIKVGCNDEYELEFRTIYFPVIGTVYSTRLVEHVSIKSLLKATIEMFSQEA
jgi:hypothetical protein